MEVSLKFLTHSHCCNMQTHNSKERWCEKEVPLKTREKEETGQEGKRERETEQNNEKEEGKARGMKKRCYSSVQD